MPHQDDHQSYIDRLLYEKETLDTNEFLRILFDFGYRELEEGLRWTPEGIKKNTEAVEKAKKAAGIQLVDESTDPVWVDRQRKPESPDENSGFSLNIGTKFTTDKDFKSKIEAYRYFKEWVAIKFPSLHFGPYSEPFPPKPIFRWIVKDNILKKLEELKVPTTARAQRFAEFVIKESGAPQKTEPTTLPHEPIPAINVFRNDGDFWTIIFNKTPLPKYSDSKGLAYIQCAFRRPGELIPNRQIEDAYGKPYEKTIDNSGGDKKADSQNRNKGRANVDETMTPETYEETLKILQQKRDDYAEKIRTESPTHPDIAALEGEIEKIEKYISENTHNGQIKDFTNDNTRAYDRVRGAISTATAKIKKDNPAFAEFIYSSIKISPAGTQYTPPPNTAPW